MLWQVLTTRASDKQAKSCTPVCIQSACQLLCFVWPMHSYAHGCCCADTWAAQTLQQARNAHPIGVGAQVEEQAGPHLHGHLRVGCDHVARASRAQLRRVQAVQRARIDGRIWEACAGQRE